MKKIGIITLWGELNYGAFLQAYALSSVLKSYDCVPYCMQETHEKMKLRSFISFKPSNLKKNIYSCKLVHGYKKDRDFLLKINTSKQLYDICIVGSDEVWNVNNSHFNHDDLYIGKNVNYKKLVAYAPSSNGATGDDFIRVYGNNCLERFAEISVRDSVTQKMIYDISHCNPPIVLDPAFLINSYKDIEIDTPYNNYVFIYGYSFSSEEIEKIKKFARKNKKIVISAGAYHEWADKKIAASPREFLGLIKHADYVITSTFHGTVFSIIYTRQFASIVRNNLKISELLKEFHLEERIVRDDLEDLEMVLKKEIFVDKLKARISDLREQSKNYLEGCINDNEI